MPRKLHNRLVRLTLATIVFLSCTAIYRYIKVTDHTYMANQNNEVLDSFNSLAGTKAFTCDNLEELQTGEKIGSGAYRDTYVRWYRDTKVAVKVLQKRFKPNKHGVSTVEREARAQINCLSIFHEHKDSDVNVLLDEIKTKCASGNMLHMLVEIVYHSVLKSDLIVENIGFCVRHPDVQRQRVVDNKKASKVKGNNETKNPSCTSV